LSEWRPNLCHCIVLANVTVLLLGALAAAPGSVAMPDASPACFHRAKLFIAVFACDASLFLANARPTVLAKSLPV
jgi:hypothetical protein